MNEVISNIPWNTRATWREANDSLSTAILTHASALADLHHLARRVRRRLESLFPLMDALCSETCPACTDICCRRAWVWADFRDLLFYHLAGVAPPGSQLIGTTDGHCRFASPRGCRLDRIRRPFLCTWYVCPAQTCLLNQRNGDQQRVASTIDHIKSQRRQMEMAFIDIVT